MKTCAITTELDRAFAAARVKGLMGGVVLCDTIDPLYAIHKALKATHASGELTDEQYTEKGRELLWMVGSRSEMRRSTKLWPEITRPGRCCRVVSQHDQRTSGVCHRLRRLNGWLVRHAHGGGKNLNSEAKRDRRDNLIASTVAVWPEIRPNPAALMACPLMTQSGRMWRRLYCTTTVVPTGTRL